MHCRWPLGSLVVIHSWLAWSLIADCCRLAVTASSRDLMVAITAGRYWRKSPDRYMLKAREPCTLRPRRPGAFRDLR
ncbi:UNVERIFIED_CONTAM: hypothetical protein Slati_1448500 [Sesamum latifolium]|uniref:Secreted protein n=1 Tax=Sesamum latifolium TaxID=2727402 RepID=A0AAW2X7L6_9LAMI